MSAELDRRARELQHLARQLETAESLAEQRSLEAQDAQRRVAALQTALHSAQEALIEAAVAGGYAVKEPA